MGRVIVSDEVELEVRRMLEELQRRTLKGGVTWRAAKPCVQALIEGREVVVASASDQGSAHQGTKKRDFAEEWRAWFETWYRGLGFAITVPKPNVTNREFARRAEKRQALVYRPATSEVSYEAFMVTVGQDNDWTVTDEGERAKIGWEPCKRGYWFWADVQNDCPRLGKTWNGLAKAIRLLSLEEYVIVWHATEVKTKRKFDTRTRSLLRTRFGPGALRANGGFGRVLCVHGHSAGALSIPNDHEGGRALDLIPASTGAGSH